MQKAEHRFLPVLCVIAVTAALGACVPDIHSTIPGRPGAALMAQLWNDPSTLGSRDLLYGSGGRKAAPDPNGVYTWLKDDNAGFSRKMEVRDASGIEWNVKFEPEAQPEVVSSRIVWALGYHQVPNYYLEKWTLDRKGERKEMPKARFRPKLKWIDKTDIWSWQKNPFLHTEQFRGLVALMILLNSTDLKNDNNALYELTEPLENARRWYVVKDLGATLGETARIAPSRGDPKAFEKERYIAGVKDGRILFDFGGRHQELLAIPRPSDVAWLCTRLEAVSDREWGEIFTAGGYDDGQTRRFVRKIREKAGEGMALANRGGQ